jgi:competence protein ComEC
MPARPSASAGFACGCSGRRRPAPASAPRAIRTVAPSSPTLDLPDVEALKVAHHGSADEGLPSLLERTRPEFAAIEVGRENTYGHPAPSTLDALRAVDHVYRTDTDGTVRLRVRNGAIAVDD